MATADYMTGRKRYQRPQGILWSNNAGTLSEGLYVPTGYEIGAEIEAGTSPSLVDQFLVLSDHNRSEIRFTPKRLEQRQRTINGRMRSYHIADKLEISWSWDNLPSRSHSQSPEFNENGKPSLSLQNATRNAEGTIYSAANEYTADGGAGGVDILDWYETHTGPFWMYLAYDKYSNFGPTVEDPNAAYKHLGQYNQVIQVYIADFNYTVVKRGGSNHDLWNISVTLEEV
jgi:hypothetical protein